jgi:sulfatase modifying factor 1
LKSPLLCCAACARDPAKRRAATAWRAACAPRSFASLIAIAAVAWAGFTATSLTSVAQELNPNPNSTSVLRYQGRLSDTAGPANGRFDLRFTLFSVAEGGNASAGPVTNIAVAVTNGLFTAAVDFGSTLIPTSHRWLEVGVRPADSAVEFTTLTPRQSLAPVPYSLHTLRAEGLTGLLPLSQLPTNVARLDVDATFTGEVRFTTNVSIGGAVVASSYAGDGSGLTNVPAIATALSARLAQRLWRVPIPFVLVTNAGNAPDEATGKGAVPYNFRMGKYEVNNNQYAVFLNAMAAEDPNGLYDTNMTFDSHGGILRQGQPGEYQYSVKPGMGHQPVVWVEFPDILRFCNWLHHGQPSGLQDGTTTEDGAYTMNPDTVWGNTIRRNPGARYWIPTDDEWYKAAYHQPSGAGGDPSHYWNYPTRSNEPPFPEEPPGFGPNTVNACCATSWFATAVGAYVEAGSYYGTFDQAGNVEEWTEEIVYVTNRRLRGGSWGYNEYYSKKTDFEFDTPDYEADGIGFRVAGSAEP